MNLVSQIKELEQEIILKENIHRNEMKELREKIKALRKMNTCCEKCAGTGKVMRRVYEKSEEETEVTCRRCGGTGEKV